VKGSVDGEGSNPTAGARRGRESHESAAPGVTKVAAVLRRANGDAPEVNMHAADRAWLRVLVQQIKDNRAAVAWGGIKELVPGRGLTCDDRMAAGPARQASFSSGADLQL
jgi:hypothetical protein